jgi:hypothetical protein
MVAERINELVSAAFNAKLELGLRINSKLDTE